MNEFVCFIPRLLKLSISKLLCSLSLSFLSLYCLVCLSIPSNWTWDKSSTFFKYGGTDCPYHEEDEEETEEKEGEHEADDIAGCIVGHVCE
jgi:hypothetical protein